MKKRKGFNLGLVAAAALFAYFSYTIIDQQKIFLAKENEAKSIQAKIDDEKKTNEQLKQQKENINSDEFIEKVAREKLGMVKQGEKIFIDISK